MKKTNLLIVLLVFLSTHSELVRAQELFSWPKEKEYCNPSVVGLPRAKALIIKYELQPVYNVQSEGKMGNYGDSKIRVNKSRRYDIRLRFPIINKPSLTIAGGLKYSVEEFSFRDVQNVTYPLYQNLEDRPLKSIGLHLYLLKPTRNKKYFILRTSLDLNGDYGSNRFPKSEFLKFSITPLIGWKQHDNLSYAVGFTYGYTFGKPLIIPVFSINKNFNCNFGIESALPINFRFRYTTHEKNYWYAGMELSGGSYRLDNKDPQFAGYDKLHLFRSELRYLATYEREIHDWLWFGIDAGYRQNLRFNLTNSPRAKSDVIINSKLKGAGIISASIFIVPPHSFLKKKSR